jgi:putative NADPH-quinone reductase
MCSANSVSLPSGVRLPLWYGALAVLKVWCDRVFVYGRAYTSKMPHDRGFFKGKRAMPI